MRRGVKEERGMWSTTHFFQCTSFKKNCFPKKMNRFKEIKLVCQKMNQFKQIKLVLKKMNQFKKYLTTLEIK